MWATDLLIGGSSIVVGNKGKREMKKDREGAGRRAGRDTGERHRPD